MSQSSSAPPMRSDALLIGIAVILLMGVFWYVTSQSQQVLRKSPAGLDGLHSWLADEGHPVRSFSGGWTSDRNTVGLRILPLYDTDLKKDRVAPGTKEDLLVQRDEYDLTLSNVKEKARIVPTLIVLPKWRSGLRLTGLGHPAMLIERERTTKLLDQIFSEDLGEVRVIPQPFTDFTVRRDDATNSVARLYIAQVFEGKGCTPLIGRTGEMVLGRCPTKSGDVWVLSDPDLVNNHGLRLGDNAHIMREILLGIAGEHAVMIDYSISIWLVNKDKIEHRERTWKDLAQFFSYPLSVLWGSAGILLVLVLWRAGRRFGPIRSVTKGPGASKQVANEAAAHLMRLTGQDGALLSDYVNARLAAIAARYLGPQHSNDPDTAMRVLANRQKDLADQLAVVIEQIRGLPSQLPAAEAIKYVDNFELILEQLDHDT